MSNTKDNNRKDNEVRPSGGNGTDRVYGRLGAKIDLVRSSLEYKKPQRPRIASFSKKKFKRIQKKSNNKFLISRLRILKEKLEIIQVRIQKQGVNENLIKEHQRIYSEYLQIIAKLNENKK